MLTQLQHFEISQRKLFAANAAFMEMVQCAANPLTRADLEALIARRPERYARFAGWLEKLP